MALTTSYMKWALSHGGLANDTRASLDFTTESWLGSMMSNERVANAVCSNEGHNIPDLVCRGERVGIVLGEDDGVGGRVAIAIIKAAVLNRLKARGDKWRQTEGEREVLLMVDECAPIINQTDADIAAQGRSLGAHLVYACQNYSQVVNVMPGVMEHGGNAFLSVFGSICTLMAEDETYKYVSSRMPFAWRLHRDNTSIEVVALDKGVEKIRTDGVQDRRQGAIGDRLSSITTMIAEARKAFSFSPTTLGERKDKMREGASEKYQLRQMGVIEVADLKSILSRQFILVGNLTRAGVSRVVVADVRPGVGTKAGEDSLKSLAFVSQSRQITQQDPEVIDVHIRAKQEMPA